MQNLSDYKAWLDFFTFEIQKFALSDHELQVPLLYASEMQLQSNFQTQLEKVKEDYTKIDSIEYLFPKDPDYPDLMTLLLTVFSSFIHLTNFYILSLAAKDYSKYVGMDESFSGVLSGVNWSSAVIFTFVYSY